MAPVSPGRADFGYPWPVLVPIAEGVYGAEKLLRMPGGARLPTRMTVVVDRTSGGVTLVSPLRLTDELMAAIDELGPVEHILAPGGFHHLFLADAVGRYPEARLAGSPTVAEKRDDLPWAEVFGPETERAAGGLLEARLIEGVPKMGEVALFHRPSGTLILADLVFNVLAPPNLQLALAMWMMGTYRRFAQSRIWRILGKDKRAAARSLRDILAWPSERLVPAHGDVLTGDIPARLERILRWPPLD